MSAESIDPGAPANGVAGDRLGEPTFIVGLPRTGSKIYRKLINEHTAINISAEIFFAAPRWSREDFMRVTKRALGSSRDDASMARVADMVFGGAYFGTYFRGIEGDRNLLEKFLLASDRSEQGIFEALLKFDARQKGKQRIGAKFPFHIASTEALIQWYPAAKYIHINRNPLAIYSSQKRKYRGNANGSIRYAITVINVLLATIVSYRSSYRFFLRHGHKPNYLLCQYEDLVTDPKTQIQRICRFLGIKFEDSMLAAQWKGSSHGHGAGVGIHQKSRDAWQGDVGWFARMTFRLTTKTRW